MHNIYSNNMIERRRGACAIYELLFFVILSHREIIFKYTFIVLLLHIQLLLYYLMFLFVLFYYKTNTKEKRTCLFNLEIHSILKLDGWFLTFQDYIPNLELTSAVKILIFQFLR